MVGISGGMANQPVKAIKKDSHESCIALICGRAKENSFMLVAFPFSSTRICFGKILVASVMLRVGYVGDETVFFLVILKTHLESLGNIYVTLESVWATIER